MDNIKNDQYYLERIQKNMTFIKQKIEGVQIDSFSQDEMFQDSMMFRLIQISENARKLSEDFKQDHSTIPWTAVYGLRNRIVHDYGNVDLTIVYDTLKNDIPELQRVLSDIV